MPVSRKLLLLAAGLSLALGGCGANFNSVYRSSTVPGNQTSITLIDAKQRAILTAERPVKKTGADGKPPFTEAYRAFCTEPSPDVFSVLSHAFSGGASFGQDKEAKTLQATLQAAFASNEVGSAIARTQTINMLREMMYRTCERYLSGALGPAEFPIQAARDQRIMVSILAIEQLTGAVTIKPTIIAANGSASVGANSSDAILKLAEAQKKRDDTAAATKKADANLAAAKKTMDEKEPGNPKCSEIKDGDTTAAARRKECAEAKEAVTIAETKQKSAREDQKTALDDYNALAAQTGNGGVLLVATTAGQLLQGGGEISSAARADTVTKVAKVVRDIVKEAYDQDEFLLMCIKQLPTGDTVTAGTVQDACLKYITESINLQTAEKKSEVAAMLKQEADDSDAISEANFKIFWSKISLESDPEKVDRTKFDPLIKGYLAVPRSSETVQKLTDLLNQTNKGDVQKKFCALDLTLQGSLIAQ